ncbi:MAG: 16S rRNA (guanine(527)-N(7))-methyltransferase RsmG [Zymomonas mobilis subsp. pomaceae]|uniref:Ribosomal RNA small subunit methyltransferase G n=1 Tax=Zymomonas mobilis subsp. pomaceae (strain ATCC 29192 / DSM 22645 / JCM 10191 / CCUG 17912 / NBRC 13757 / NCIMB 11200 / NRRL B-4491 / Barker I) TaxID=579138 RepID=F8ETX1_ZYMMT|nr:16S rRNA (guanine(527)-N(7))-methyltransferase RsmG [Zymomonas mobilis]AEI38068.1 methyltransferase GidB [Zymomonas mobilis subsp. pomaceae ATCC 29192]MDX5949435.1 16S rRNA (guanine(527)-N(7))-methyltransferase RsmG [Zymomonas mobilis subsp. pomaceae]GEB89178.1 ribosomal RNA small subunit methyltransferase G [Zymomonas mobilis subsp. pomaceae]
MTRDEALLWLDHHIGISRETVEKLDAFVACLLTEMAHQNLIARSTVDSLWGRHIVDSAQLLPLAKAEISGKPPYPKNWLDLGSGAGFPGIVIAILSDIAVTLVESRRKRVEFLQKASEAARTPVTILGQRLENIEPQAFDIITARAFAPLDKLWRIATPFAHKNTLWLLPKGQNATAELEETRKLWQGAIRIVPSATDPQSAVIVAKNIHPQRHKAGRKP